MIVDYAKLVVHLSSMMPSFYHLVGQLSDVNSVFAVYTVIIDCNLNTNTFVVVELEICLTAAQSRIDFVSYTSTGR